MNNEANDMGNDARASPGILLHAHHTKRGDGVAATCKPDQGRHIAADHAHE